MIDHPRDEQGRFVPVKLDMRLVRSDNVVLVEMSFTEKTTLENAVEVMGIFAADQALAALSEGYGWRIDLVDPFGLITEAGEWTTVVECQPMKQRTKE